MKCSYGNNSWLQNTKHKDRNGGRTNDRRFHTWSRYLRTTKTMQQQEQSEYIGGYIKASLADIFNFTCNSRFSLFPYEEKSHS